MTVRVQVIKKLVHLLIIVLEHVFPRLQGVFGKAEDTPWMREFDRLFDSTFRLWEGRIIPPLEGQHLCGRLRELWASYAPHGAQQWTFVLPYAQRKLQETLEWRKLEQLYIKWKAEQQRRAIDADLA